MLRIMLLVIAALRAAITLLSPGPRPSYSSHGAYGPLNSTHNASHYAFSYSSAARCYNVTKPRATAQLFFTMITSIRATIMTPADLSIVHRAPSPWGAGPCD